jgi:hypothetical protein
MLDKKTLDLMPLQFYVLLHFDQTRAVEPLERTPEWSMAEASEPAETYPSGL